MPPSPEKSLVTSPGVGRSWKVPSTPMSLLDDSGRFMHVWCESHTQTA